MRLKKTVPVTLGNIEIEIVEKEEFLDGSNFSAALRKIIREWSRTNSKETVIVGPEPIEKDN